MYDNNDDNDEEDTFGHNVWWCVQDITPCHRPARCLPPPPPHYHHQSTLPSSSSIHMNIITTSSYRYSILSSHHHHHIDITIAIIYDINLIITSTYGIDDGYDRYDHSHTIIVIKVIHDDNLNIQPYGWKAPSENCTLRGAAAETILPRFDTMINLVVKAAYGSFQSGSKFITKNSFGNNLPASTCRDGQ